MKTEPVTFTCPQCGKVWIEEQDVNDEWFKLATNKTLCAKCGEEALRAIKNKGIKMSYDIMFGVKYADGDDDYAVIGHPEYDSPTWNLHKMFVQCMDWDFECEKWYPVTEIMPYIQRGISELTNCPSKYTKYEPENGWGNINTALSALESIFRWLTDEYSGLHGGWNQNIPMEYIYMRW